MNHPRVYCTILFLLVITSFASGQDRKERLVWDPYVSFGTGITSTVGGIEAGTIEVPVTFIIGSRFVESVGFEFEGDIPFPITFGGDNTPLHSGFVTASVFYHLKGFHAGLYASGTFAVGSSDGDSDGGFLFEYDYRIPHGRKGFYFDAVLQVPFTALKGYKEDYFMTKTWFTLSGMVGFEFSGISIEANVSPSLSTTHSFTDDETSADFSMSYGARIQYIGFDFLAFGADFSHALNADTGDLTFGLFVEFDTQYQEKKLADFIFD